MTFMIILHTNPCKCYFYGFEKVQNAYIVNLILTFNIFKQWIFQAWAETEFVFFEGVIRMRQ